MITSRVVLMLVMIFMTKAECKVRVGTKSYHRNDFKALKDFKAGIHYDDSLRIKKWIGRSCCQWEGISCDNITGRVTQMNLPGAITIDDAPAQTTMKGVLSPSLYLLSFLEVLDLSGLSQLGGQIPPEIGHLRHLRGLYLFMNNLSGPIPESIGKLSKLEEMVLHANSLSGALPSSIGNLSSLRILDLDYNNISGSIPDSIANLRKLENLYLQNNFLSGYIPPNIGEMRALQDLDLSNNLLKGRIPRSIIKLKFITRITVSNNFLTGKIPSSFGHLESLGIFSLDNNQFEGRVPFSFGNLRSLYELNLSGNRFSGKLPRSIGRLPLATLSVSHNMIEGPLPFEMSSLKKLGRLDLSFNPLNLLSLSTWIIDLPSLYIVHLAGVGLKGVIPGYLETAASRWVELDLSANHLSGKIPLWLGHFNFNYLNLSLNSFASQIPTTFATLGNLGVLDLHSNNLTGSLTSVFQMASNFLEGQLDYLDLSNNSFSGDIKQIGVGTQLNLGHINLSHNFLQGELPTSVGNLKSLVALDLSYNKLNSVLPESLANATNLKTLMLQNNNFRGKIPETFLKLGNLKELNLSNNVLSGEIPSGEPLIDFPKSSYSGNKGLCGKPLDPCGSNLMSIV